MGTADKSNTVEVTAPSDSPSAKPEEVAEGEESPAVKAQANGSPPSKESSLPSDAPPEVGEGENPDAVGQEAGTLDESDTVEVSLSPDPYQSPLHTSSNIVGEFSIPVFRSSIPVFNLVLSFASTQLMVIPLLCMYSHVN